MTDFIQCGRCEKLKKETIDCFADSRMDIFDLNHCKCKEGNKYIFKLKNYERLNQKTR